MTIVISGSLEIACPHLRSFGIHSPELLSVPAGLLASLPDGVEFLRFMFSSPSVDFDVDSGVQWAPLDEALGAKTHNHLKLVLDVAAVVRSLDSAKREDLVDCLRNRFPRTFAQGRLHIMEQSVEWWSESFIRRHRLLLSPFI